MLKRTNGQICIRFLAALLALLPALAASVAASSAAVGDGLLCTSRGAIAIRFDPLTGTFSEVPATPSGSEAHSCCVLSCGCAGGLQPVRDWDGLSYPVCAVASGLRCERAGVVPPAIGLCAHPIRGPPVSPPA